MSNTNQTPYQVVYDTSGRLVRQDIMALDNTVRKYETIGVTTDISDYTTIYTVPTTGLYQISTYAVAVAGSDTPGNLIINWTDETGPQALAFLALPTTAGTFSSFTTAVHAMVGTVIKFYTGGTAGPWATLVEDIYITVAQL
jgi:hypothetical protein